MVTVTHRVGKLVAVRVQSPVTYREATMLKPRMEQVIGRLNGPVCVACDLSDARVYSPDVAEKIVAALKERYPTAQRIGIVVHSGSSLGGLIYSYFRELDDPERQAWVRAREMVSYVSERLGGAEQQGLRDFLEEATSSAAMSAK